MTPLDLIKEIRKAYSSNLYLSALSLALILPDLYGYALYDDLRNNNCVGIRYKKFLQNHINVNEDIADCIYSLRCSWVHTARYSTTSRDSIKRYKFGISNDDFDSVAIIRWIEDKNNNSFSVNISYFINNLCIICESLYYENVKSFNFMNDTFRLF